MTIIRPTTTGAQAPKEPSMTTPPEIDWCAKYVEACQEMRQLRERAWVLHLALVTLTPYAAADRRHVEASGDGPWPDATAAIEDARYAIRQPLSLGDDDEDTP